MSWYLEAEIVLAYKSIKEASSVARAICPDNLKTPKGLLVTTRREGRNVVTSVKCELNLRTFMATIDDILSCVSVAERSLKITHVLSQS